MAMRTLRQVAASCLQEGEDGKDSPYNCRYRGKMPLNELLSVITRMSAHLEIIFILFLLLYYYYIIF